MMEATVRAEVKKFSMTIEFETAERCHISETANDSGDELVSIVQASTPSTLY